MGGMLQIEVVQSDDTVHVLQFEDPAPLRSVAPEYPEALEKVIAKMLARDPLKRYPNVKEAYQAFEEAYLATTTVTELTE